MESGAAKKIKSEVWACVDGAEEAEALRDFRFGLDGAADKKGNIVVAFALGKRIGRWKLK